MHLVTDSKSLFEIISKGTRTGEKWIMLNVREARQAYRLREIFNIGFDRSASDLANGLTKLKMVGELLNLLNTGKHIVKCEQWILRNKRIGARVDERIDLVDM